jgi:hypothetical protein
METQMRLRGFIEELLEAEPDAALRRDRYQRLPPAGTSGDDARLGAQSYENGNDPQHRTTTNRGAAINLTRC